MFNEKIEDMEQEMVSSLQGCVRIDSVRSMEKEGLPFGEGVQRALEYTLKLAEQLGFKVKNIENKVGYAEYGKGKEMIAVLTHLDVVPAGEGWTYPPFGGEIHEGKIFGRGVLDDKGAAIGALYALKAIADSGLELNRRIRIIFGTCEETGGDDMQRYKQTEELPVMGFTPDAEYPVIFAEKGIVNALVTKEIDQTDADIFLEELSGGEAVNIVPSFASAVVIGKESKRINLKAIGKTAHGSTPEKGENAIVNLLKQLKEIELCEGLMKFIKFVNNNIGTETDGKSLGIAFRDEISGAVTVNVGTIKLEGNEIQACLDIRYPVTADFERLKRALEENAQKYGMSVRIKRHKHSLYVPEKSTLVKSLLEVYKEQTGDEVKPIAIGGGTYAKEIDNIVAFGMLFPGQEDVMHQKDEYLSIENLKKNVKIMASAMYKLSK